MTAERKFVAENIKRTLLKEFLHSQIERAGFGGLEIQRTPMGTRVTLVAERPGMVIGRKGSTIKRITREVEERFSFNNPQIEVQEAEDPNLNAPIMAQKLAFALERGWHFRRAGHSTVQRIMRAGAKGCQVILSGKLTGQRHRTEKFKEGHIKYCGETVFDWMDEGFAVAKKKLGTIGVKVQIMDPKAVLPDEVTVGDYSDEELTTKNLEIAELVGEAIVVEEREIIEDESEEEVLTEDIASGTETSDKAESEEESLTEEVEETEPETEEVEPEVKPESEETDEAEPETEEVEPEVKPESEETKEAEPETEEVEPEVKSDSEETKEAEPETEEVEPEVKSDSEEDE